MSSFSSAIRFCRCLTMNAGLGIALLAIMTVGSLASTPKDVSDLQQGSSKSVNLASPKMPKRPGIATSNKSA